MGHHKLVAGLILLAVFLPVASNGQVSFLPAVNTNISPNLPQMAAAGDFNGDGKLDMAVTYVNSAFTSFHVLILLGNGDGSFRPGADYVIGQIPAFNGNRPYIVAANLNLDYNLDLAVTDGVNSTVSILLGNGDGTFQAPLVYVVCAGPASLTVADLNGDRNPDLVVPCTGGFGGLVVLLGNGYGTFRSFASSYTSSLLTQEYSAAVGDFNGDGKPDLALTAHHDTLGGGVSILLGKGDGTFQAPVVYGIGTSQAQGVIAADFNGDGKLDLAVEGTGANVVAVLMGKGDGTFKSPVKSFIGEDPFFLGPTCEP